MEQDEVIESFDSKFRAGTFFLIQGVYQMQEQRKTSAPTV
jgi:hypothetical protein